MPTSTPKTSSDSIAPAPRWLVVTTVVLVVAVVAAGVLTVVTVAGQRRLSSPAEREIRELTRVLEEDPADTNARLALGYAYQRAGRYQDAISAYDAVLSAAPDSTAALYNKGISLLEIGRDDQGEEALRHVLAISPEHALAAKALGVRLEASGEWAELAEVLLPVVQADERAADLQALLGRAYEELHDPARAEKHYLLALTYDPEMTDALNGLLRLKVEP